MSLRDNRFLEPEKGDGGVMGWAVKLLVFWALGGIALYAFIANGGLPTTRDLPPKSAVQTNAADKPPPVVSSNSLILRAGRDGYVYAEVSVNGTPLRMAFDTGASLVSLSQADAQKAGIAGALSYSMVFQTANGTARGAPVTLREIRIGQLVIEDVHGVVMQNLGVSLLGQSFLSRLDSYQMRDGVLTLTW